MRRSLAILTSVFLLFAGCSASSDGPRQGSEPGSGAAGSTALPESAEASAADATQSPTDSNQGTPSSTPSPTPSPTPTPEPVRELPGGGTQLFPQHRLCGFVGSPGAPGQGRLGIDDLNDRMAELHQACAPYAAEQQIMPVMELIAVTVKPYPGEDGMWRERTDPAVVAEWLRMARQHNAILLLNIQPGQASFLDEVRAFEQFLIEPDVGVALDPEWAMEPGQVPMQNFGSVTGAELDEVSHYLAGLVEMHRLPEKVMLYHILHPQIISDEWALLERPGVVLVKSVDGIGSPADKTATYNLVKAEVPPYVHLGFKLFYEEDVQTSGWLMSPEEVLALDPRPWYVLYE